jgi:hypothetical protein
MSAWPLSEGNATDSLAPFSDAVSTEFARFHVRV